MGLGTVELLMEIEDAFELRIPDADFDRLHTVGQTVEYVLRRVNDGWRDGVPICPSARAFYRLRRQLGQRQCLTRDQVRPGRAMADLFPDGIKRVTWNEMAAAAGLRPERFRLGRLFGPDAVESRLTLADVIRTRQLPRPSYQADEQAVFDALRRVVAKVARVDESRVTRETHYFKDLF